jgi:IS1 family transposase
MTKLKMQFGSNLKWYARRLLQLCKMQNVQKSCSEGFHAVEKINDCDEMMKISQVYIIEFEPALDLILRNGILPKLV